MTNQLHLYILSVFFLMLHRCIWFFILAHMLVKTCGINLCTILTWHGSNGILIVLLILAHPKDSVKGIIRISIDNTIMMLFHLYLSCRGSHFQKESFLHCLLLSFFPFPFGKVPFKELNSMN